MFDFMKKTVFTGLGLAYMTKEKLAELAKEITEKGNLSEKEGQEIFAELNRKSKESRGKIEAQIRASVQEYIKKMNLATKDDLKELEEKINNLAEMVKSQQTVDKC